MGEDPGTCLGRRRLRLARAHPPDPVAAPLPLALTKVMAGRSR